METVITENKCRRLTWDELVEALVAKINKETNSAPGTTYLTKEDVTIIFKNQKNDILFNTKDFHRVEVKTSTMHKENPEDTPSDYDLYPRDRKKEQ